MSELTDKIKKNILDPIFVTNIDKKALFEIIEEVAQIAEAGGGGSVIPLSGTIEGNPVNGDVELSDGIKLFIIDGSVRIGGELYGISFPNDGSVNNAIVSYPSTSKGLSGESDYTPNITDLDFVQKKYVDNQKGKHISKTTTEISAIVTPQAGETYFNSTLNTLCFYNGTVWKQVSSTNMV